MVAGGAMLVVDGGGAVVPGADVAEVAVDVGAALRPPLVKSKASSTPAKSSAPRRSNAMKTSAGRSRRRRATLP